MDQAQQRFWNVMLELKLRKNSGNAFQDFFSDVMERAYGEDFVRIRPYGRRGDKGCDGYIKSEQHFFQCYGAEDQAQNKVNALLEKMDVDFNTCQKNFSGMMNMWSMVHNFVGGLPMEAAEKVHELEQKVSGVEIRFFGKPKFEEIIFSLSDENIAYLLGDAPTTEILQDIRYEEIRNLLNHIVTSTTIPEYSDIEVKPVPQDKMSYNEITPVWQQLIRMGIQNSHHVTYYLSRIADPTFETNLAHALNARYKYLKTQKLESSTILTDIYGSILGTFSPTPTQQVAGTAILAFFFEKCDIFEDQPRSK